MTVLPSLPCREIVTHEVPQRGIVAPPTVGPTCPPELSSLIERCLRLESSARPSAAEVLAALREIE